MMLATFFWQDREENYKKIAKLNEKFLKNEFQKIKT
jgi:hypothetical protein